MNRNYIIGAALVGLLVIAGVIWLITSGGDDSAAPAATFTPPPISDDPPMSSDNIDQIMQEMEERRK